jgi:hypothetical protein
MPMRVFLGGSPGPRIKKIIVSSFSSKGVNRFTETLGPLGYVVFINVTKRETAKNRKDTERREVCDLWYIKVYRLSF